MKQATLAFIFTPDFTKVLLIHKLSPEWQKGKVNGVGGKTEAEETPRECITREVFEETALVFDIDSWIEVGEMKEDGMQVSVFTVIYDGDLNNAKSNDKEEIEWVDTDSLPENVISNVRWLIPLSLDKLQHNLYETFTVTYKKEG